MVLGRLDFHFLSPTLPKTKMKLNVTPKTVLLPEGDKGESFQDKHKGDCFQNSNKSV